MEFIKIFLFLHIYSKMSVWHIVFTLNYQTVALDLTVLITKADIMQNKVQGQNLLTVLTMF